MPAPSFQQVKEFGAVSKQLREAALAEFMEYVYDGMDADEMAEAAANVAAKYSRMGCELGAQWYDICSEAAGLDVEPAEYEDVDIDALTERAHSVVARPGDSKATLDMFLQNAIAESIRATGYANLWRDYRRGMAGGKWARVPVGDTCAWCLLLASQGAWYISEESALGKHAGHYHDGCDCVAVYHADAESIAGYSALESYKAAYYDAENLVQANADPTNPYSYPQALFERIAAAKAEHDARFDEGGTDEEWRSEYNEALIVMRWQNGLK